jgi:hypothetical protein
VLDGMVLVAATAVGLWIGLLTREQGSGWPVPGRPDFSNGILHVGTYRKIHVFLTEVSYKAMPVILPLTSAILLLRLRKPRPSFRRICRRPGFAACLAVTLVTVASFLGCFASDLERTTWGDDYTFRFKGMLHYCLVYSLDSASELPFGSAVAAVWGVMALGRMFRREPGWIDRTGRLLGTSWLVMFILSVSQIQAD